jgi:GGDEF domain-containing protein
MTVSIGVAMYDPFLGESAYDLVAPADMTLYRARQGEGTGSSARRLRSSLIRNPSLRARTTGAWRLRSNYELLHSRPSNAVLL